MKTSIIIPTLNEAERLRTSLRRAWETRPHEVLVVDGGSSDNTVDIARHVGCRVLTSPRGRAAQQNMGAQHATGDVLLFLHADNWLSPSGVRQIEKALTNPRVMAGAFQHRIEASGLIYRVLERGNTMRARVLRLVYGDQGIFVRRSVFHQVGGFPEVDLMEDVLLVRKISRHSPVTLLAGPLYVSARRWQQNGPLRQTARNWAITFAEMSGIPPNDLAPFYPPPGKPPDARGR